MKRALVVLLMALAACDAAPGDAPATQSSGGAIGDLPAFFDCLRTRGLTTLSAHRGGPAPGFAENAIPTFENTLRIASHALLEVDVSQTADGVLVLMHDERIERTTTGSGAVRELDLAQLLAFTLQDERGRAVDARAPTLREALDWAEGRAILELDIKRDIAFEDVVRDVEAAGAMRRVVFITYSTAAAARLARIAPQAMIYTSISSEQELEALRRRDVDLSRIVAWVGSGRPDGDLIAALDARGVEVRLGVFGDNRDYASAASAGVHIVAVDDVLEAFRDLDDADGEPGFAAALCPVPR